MRLPFGFTLNIGRPPVHTFVAPGDVDPKAKGADSPAPPKGSGQVGWAVGTTLFQLGDFPRYNPDTLQVKKGRDVYDRMMLDDQVKACAEFKRDAVTSRGYYFDKKNKEDDDGFDDEHVRIESFFKATIDQMEMPFKDGLDAILTGMRSGFSVTEKVYKTITWEERPYWGLKKLVLLPFHTFDGGIVAKQGTSDVVELRQMVGGRPVTTIPRDKVVYFVHRPDVDPLYGESDLKAAYRPYWSKDIAIKFQNIHLERHAGGFIKATVKDAGVLNQPGVKDSLKSTLENITSMTALLAPAGVDVDIVPPARTDAYDRAIQGYDKAIAKAQLVPNLLGLSEQGDTGSYSQSQTQLEVFFFVLDKIIERLEDALNRQLFSELALYNFNTTDYPKFKFEPLTVSQKHELAKTWGELMKAGAVQRSEVDENHTRKLLGYPDLPEDFVPPTPAVGIDPATGKPIKTTDDDTDPEKKKEPVKKDNTACRHDHKTDPEKTWNKRVDFAAIRASLDSNDRVFAQQLADIMGRAKKYIQDQVIAVAGDKSFGKVDAAAIMDVGRMPRPLLRELRQAIRNNLQRVLDENYLLARKDLPRKASMKAIAPGMDKLQAERFLASRAMKIAGVLDQDVLNSVQQVLENALRYDKNLRDTIESIETSTDLLAVLPRFDAAMHAINIPARLENIARTNNADAVNSARMALFGEPEFRDIIQAFEYSAILDDRTTDECETLDGEIRREWGSLTPPNHYQCRSILVPVTDEDNWNGKQDRIPAWVKPQKGFA